MSTRKEEVELIKKLKSGSKKAFNSIYYQYHQAIYANILRIVKEDNKAEDLLQETFITLWEKKSTLNDKKPIGNWLFVVSFNRAINYFRKSKLTNIIPLESCSHSISETYDSKADSEVAVQLDLLEKAIEQLSPQKRNVFILCKIKGKTYAETAKELNISKHTVKEYLSNAMQSVKTYISNHPYEDVFYMILWLHFLT